MLFLIQTGAIQGLERKENFSSNITIQETAWNIEKEGEREKKHAWIVHRRDLEKVEGVPSQRQRGWQRALPVAWGVGSEIALDCNYVLVYEVYTS